VHGKRKKTWQNNLCWGFRGFAHDGKATLLGVQGRIRKTWQNNLCWGFRGFTHGTGLVIFVDREIGW